MSKLALVVLVSVALVAGGIVPSATAQQEDRFPAPTGPHQVGVTSLTLVDETREEVYTDDPDDSRAVTIWIWYPADVAEGSTPSPYLMDGYDVELSAFASDVGALSSDVAAIREWLDGRLRHAFREAPVSASQATYPVIVYTAVTPIAQSVQFEELASHGYVVVNVVGVTGYSFKDAGSIVKIGDGYINWNDFLFDLLFKDYLFVLDQLEALNSGDIDSLLTGHLNLGQLGAAGWSYAGWVAMEATSQDDRIKAGVTQDYESDRAMDRPFLFMRGTTCPRYDVTGPAYFMHAEGFRHTNFSDFALFPLPEGSAPDLIGSIDAVRGAEIINAYIVAFFDQYLKGEERPLLQGPSADFPEVEIVSRNVPEETANPPQIISPQVGDVIVIDDFETGTLDAWSVACLGSGSWHAYDDGTTPPNPAQSDPYVPFDAPDPPQGEFAAVTDMAGASTLLLYRDLTLDGAYRLHLNVFYRNQTPPFFNPNTLAYNTVTNQQFRIDLVDPAAPVDSLAADDVLATIFQTSPGDPSRLDPTEITFDLSPWEGQTVRLRFANVNNRSAFRSGVDNIWVELIQ